MKKACNLAIMMEAFLPVTLLGTKSKHDLGFAHMGPRSVENLNFTFSDFVK